jgi:hypothetical protein
VGFLALASVSEGSVEEILGGVVVRSYGDLEGVSNVCGNDTLDTYNNQNDRYYGSCMADEIQN